MTDAPPSLSLHLQGDPERVHGDFGCVVFIAQAQQPSGALGRKDSMDLQKINGKWKVSLIGSFERGGP